MRYSNINPLLDLARGEAKPPKLKMSPVDTIPGERVCGENFWVPWGDLDLQSRSYQCKRSPDCLPFVLREES